MSVTVNLAYNKVGAATRAWRTCCSDVATTSSASSFINCFYQSIKFWNLLSALKTLPISETLFLYFYFSFSYCYPPFFLLFLSRCRFLTSFRATPANVNADATNSQSQILLFSPVLLRSRSEPKQKCFILSIDTASGRLGIRHIESCDIANGPNNEEECTNPRRRDDRSTNCAKESEVRSERLQIKCSLS